MATIRIPTLIGGVSRAAQSQRAPHMVEGADNVSLAVSRGAEKRAGTEFIFGATSTGELDVTEPTNEKHVHWMDRNADEQFVMLIDPDLQGDVLTEDATVEIFNLEGDKQSVAYDATDPRPYLASGSGDPRRKLRTISVADATLILNKAVITALSGSGITYIAHAANLRNQSNANNVPSWSDFDHPPTGTVSEGTVSSNFLWYAREDDVGQPQGFYGAVSTTAPPWYTRRRTEGANSLIDAGTVPIRMDFDGTTFTVKQVTWKARYSGDSATNPGPAFIGGTLSDLAVHQGRLFIAGGERLVSSQAGDFFNLWINSSILQVDSDPIDTRIGNNRISNIEFLTGFRDSLVMNTSGEKQFELRSDGPLTPSTARMEPTTSFNSVDYVQPATMGDQMYFAGERNFANTLYEYYLSPDSVSNVALDVTSTVEGYIPAQISLMEASEAHDTLFILTDAEPNNIYVYKTTFNGQQKVISSWFRWITDEDNEIMSIKTFGDDLYILIRRNEAIYLEKVAIETPEQDVLGDFTMGFAVRLDRKQFLIGDYDLGTNITTWTLPFEDETITEIVLGPTWDVDVGDEEQRLKGTRLTPTVTLDSGNTLLTFEGQYEHNLNGDQAGAYVGRPYLMDIELSQQYVRDQQGIPLFGNVQLLTCTARHRDTGYYTVEITPGGRETFIKEFVFPRVGSSPFDGEFIEENGEFRFRVLAASHSVSVHIKNDSPLPSNIVDLEFIVNFVPQRGNPNR